MALFVGTAQGVEDRVTGRATNDVLKGLSGDDVLIGRNGNDTIAGGKGSDVMDGGLGSDRFDFSAGHLQNDATDYIRDFLLGTDTLRFLNSGKGQVFEILSVVLEKLTIAEFNGTDLQNNINRDDMIFTVRNSVTQAEQEIVLMDTGPATEAWEAYLAQLGTSFTDMV